MKYSAVLWVLLCCASLCAQETAVDGADEKVKERHARMLELAKSYTFTAESKTQIQLRETPIFAWSTPERQALGGELFLWTLEGRPLATIGIWTYDDIKDSHELQSLCVEPLRATSQTGFSWRPSAGGLVFNKLDGAPPPGNSAIRRQAQMRALLRERFSAEMIKRENGQLEKLRLLPQPLYRYEPLPAGVEDGAMFAFAMGTDPEVFVLLEARKEANGSAWYYAFAPSTSVEVHGMLDARQVWDNNNQETNGTFVFIYNR